LLILKSVFRQCTIHLTSRSKLIKTSRKYINGSIKVLLILGLVFIINNFIFNVQLEKLDFQFLTYEYIIQNLVWIILALFLMPLNWLIESRKWQVVMQISGPIGLTKSFYSILSGVTFGILTPARIGEYVGRMLLVEKKKNTQSVYSSFLCSISQNTIILVLGLLSAFQFLRHHSILEINTQWMILLNGFVLAFSLVIYFKHQLVLTWIQKKGWFQNRIDFRNIKLAHTPLLLRVLFLALSRYLIYSFQFICILLFLGINASFAELFICIGLIYLIQSTLPVPPIIGLITRSEIAILVFATLNYNSWLIVIATSIIWIINLILPALLGLVIILRTNIVSSFGYE